MRNVDSLGTDLESHVPVTAAHVFSGSATSMNSLKAENIMSLNPAVFKLTRYSFRYSFAVWFCRGYQFGVLAFAENTGRLKLLCNHWTKVLLMN